MRDLVIARLGELKNSVDGNGFSKKMMRWRHVDFYDQHVSEVDFSKLDDAKLLVFYEKILRHMNKCMG